MKRIFLYGLILIAFMTLVGYSLVSGEAGVFKATNKPPAPVPQRLVSHAGGAIYGFKYTNSLEALNQSYEKGYTLIELDFQWTSDNQLVILHDWDPMVKRLFMTEPRVFTYDEFLTADVFQDLTLMDLDKLSLWLKQHPDVFIVTDIKAENIKGLRLISEKYPDIQRQIIPQIYSFEEYPEARSFGYENIILTLYKSTYSEEEIIAFANAYEVFAITMPLELGRSQLPRRLKEMDTVVYVHTINELYIYEELIENGVFGIYTDYFEPNRWVD